MGQVESSRWVPADDFGIQRERLALTLDYIPFDTDPVRPNNGLASVDKAIDRVHGLGKLTINDILLDVGVKPYKPWPPTQEFRNID